MAIHVNNISEKLKPFLSQDYQDSEWFEWAPNALAIIESNCRCKVCWAIPQPDGYRDHGRGCYMVNEDGGGFDYFDSDELLKLLKV